uniref:hypothetical protein n=1 Tax=Nocardia donostiensis TaxID=1538463 RepID=UPI001594B3AE|nr:hypothetical protein [Nocardia donostiensis]
MRKYKDPALRPGARVRVRFGGRIVEGVVTSAEGGRIHVALDIDGADDPVSGLYQASELIPA